MAEKCRVAGETAEMSWESVANAAPAAGAQMQPDPVGWGCKRGRVMAGKELFSQWYGAQPHETPSIRASEFNTTVFLGVSGLSDEKEKRYHWYQGNQSSK